MVMDVKALGRVAGGVEAARRGAVAVGPSDARPRGAGPAASSRLTLPSRLWQVAPDPETARDPVPGRSLSHNNRSASLKGRTPFLPHPPHPRRVSLWPDSGRFGSGGPWLHVHARHRQLSCL